MAGRKLMKRVPALVDHRAHVAVHTNRVHENEGMTGLLVRRLIPAGGLALATREVEIRLRVHLVELGAEVRMHAVKYARHLHAQLVHGRKRRKRGSPLYIDG